MKALFLLLFQVLLISEVYSQQLAFPTAEGYGKYTQGGRGGVVYEVNQLGDSGKGSLRAAVEAEGPRTVIFKVSGNIELTKPLVIQNPFITIAGQTAPGEGICLKNYPLNIDADQVIVRYLRVRPGDISGEDYDAVSSRYRKHIILDHLSVSWSIDETMSIYHGDSITVQWCIISESLSGSNHVKGPHGFGGIWGSNHSSYHHNLLAHHSSRNPRMASGSGYTDFRNNVIYNWGCQSLYGGEKQQVGNDKFLFSAFNIIANYYKPGPATKPGVVSYRIANPGARNENDFGKWFIADNVMEGNREVTIDNWRGGVQTEIPTDSIRLKQAWKSMQLNQQPAEEAYALVLEHAGAMLPKRDKVDLRIIKEVKDGYATFEGESYKSIVEIQNPSKRSGIIDSQNDVGGWPALKNEDAPKDSDHDGMPNDWENMYGLNPDDPTDRNKLGEDGYTMLEKYLNNIK